MSGLGYDMVLNTPLGPQTISLPLEKMVADLSKTAINDAWPSIQKKIDAELPGIMAQAENQALTVLWPKLKPKIEAEGAIIVSNASKTIAPVAILAVAGVVASTWLAAWWIKKKR